MLEDYTMEKKPSGRLAQVPGKACGTELKKSQDVVSSKPFSRTFRRREPNGSSGTKFEPNRKPLPQKNKSFDKRPRPRGQYYSCGKENTKVAEEDEAEFGSVFVPGSKKQNLNHLLNFHYAPRESVIPGSGHWRSSPPSWGRQGSARWLSSAHKHKYNKEQFLQANCQFVVKADGDYSSYTSNPDALVNWDLIEQIRLQSSEKLLCPICLYPPVAAKMTHCGHVYCWSCILHYLALSDKTWRKCPICYEAVHKHDLKSVIAVPHTQLSVGEEVTMRLMKRERGSLVALPVNQCGIRPVNKLLSVSELVVDTVYSKLLLATPEEVLSIVEDEHNELQKQLHEDQDCPEKCFIEQAIDLSGERIVALSKMKALKAEKSEPEIVNEAVLEIKNTSENEHIVVYNSAFDNEYAGVDISNLTSSPSVLSQDVEKNQKLLPFQHKTTEEENNSEDFGLRESRCRYESVSSEGIGSDDGNTTVTVEDLEIPDRVGSNSEQLGVPPLKHFYFYQVADGQHTYLHALNVRMLEHSYGSLENCPPVVTGHIVEKESGSMTEELRRRLRYLQHLPVTCQFEVVEIQLKPPIVTKGTLENFQDQIDTRRRRRQRRARDERRREKKITEEENRRWGHYPAPHIRIDSHHQFPECDTNVSPVSSASRESITPLMVTTENLSLESERKEETPSAKSSELPGMSFAQMLRVGKSKNCSSGRLNKDPSSLKPTRVQHKGHNSDTEPDPEDYVPVPTFNQSFSDAIAVALEKAAANKDQPKGDGGFSSGKKKKQKQKVLFTTGMACSSK